MKVFLTSLALLLLPLTASGLEFDGSVTKVLEGDRLEILNQGHFYQVRLAFVFTPQPGQAFSKQAKKFTEDWLVTKRVHIKAYGQTKGGVLIGEVSYQEKNLGRELVKQGLGWEYTPVSEDPELAKLQSQAKKQKMGLWSEDSPTPPWKYKSSKKK